MSTLNTSTIKSARKKLEEIAAKNISTSEITEELFAGVCTVDVTEDFIKHNKCKAQELSLNQESYGQWFRHTITAILTYAGLIKTLSLIALCLTDGRCFYCGEQLVICASSRKCWCKLKTFNLDHIYPACKGGMILVLACEKCNNRKSDTDPIEWIKRSWVENGDASKHYNKSEEEDLEVLQALVALVRKIIAEKEPRLIPIFDNSVGYDAGGNKVEPKSDKELLLEAGNILMDIIKTTDWVSDEIPTDYDLEIRNSPNSSYYDAYRSERDGKSDSARKKLFTVNTMYEYCEEPLNEYRRTHDKKLLSNRMTDICISKLYPEDNPSKNSKKIYKSWKDSIELFLSKCVDPNDKNYEKMPDRLNKMNVLRQMKTEDPRFDYHQYIDLPDYIPTTNGSSNITGQLDTMRILKDEADRQSCTIYEIMKSTHRIRVFNDFFNDTEYDDNRDFDANSLLKKRNSILLTINKYRSNNRLSKLPEGFFDTADKTTYRMKQLKTLTPEQAEEYKKNKNVISVAVVDDCLTEILNENSEINMQQAITLVRRQLASQYSDKSKNYVDNTVKVLAATLGVEDPVKHETMSLLEGMGFNREEREVMYDSAGQNLRALKSLAKVIFRTIEEHKEFDWKPTNDKKANLVKAIKIYSRRGATSSKLAVYLARLYGVNANDIRIKSKTCSILLWESKDEKTDLQILAADKNVFDAKRKKGRRSDYISCISSVVTVKDLVDIRISMEKRHHTADELMKTISSIHNIGELAGKDSSSPSLKCAGLVISATYDVSFFDTKNYDANVAKELKERAEKLTPVKAQAILAGD